MTANNKMPSFVSRLPRPSSARGQLQAPPAQGQAQVNALLNPVAFGSNDLDNLIRVIHEADPQARRGLGIAGRGRPSPAPTSSVSPPQLGTNGTNPLPPEAGGLENNTEPNYSSTGRVPDPAASTESFANLSPPMNLLIEDGGYAAYSSSPGSQGHPLLRDLRVAIAVAAADYDSDTSTLVGGVPGADSLFDHDAQEFDPDDSEASLPPSHSGSVQGIFESPGESSGSQAPRNGCGQAGQAPPPLNTSVLSFSTDDTEHFKVRIPGESTHTSPTSSYHSYSSDESMEQTVLDDLREEEGEEE